VQYQLISDEGDKPEIDEEDLAELLQYHWASDINKFPDERHRDQLPAYILLAGYTGFRPCALLGLRWADLKLMWVRQKDGGVELALLVTPAKTKGKKKRKWA